MHILHVFDHSLPLHSGYSFRSRAILREQERLGWRTSHITGPKHNLADLPANREEVDGLTFYRTPYPGGLAGKIPLLDQFAISGALRRRLKGLAEALKPDIIHAHSPALTGFAANAVGKALGIPVVYEIRGFWEDAAVSHGTTRHGSPRYCLGRALENRVARDAQAITCICEGIRDELIKRGFSADKITIIPNAVDIDKFAPVGKADDELKRSLGLENCQVLGFIGSFYAYEGLDILLRALPALKRREASTRLLLVGGGPEEAALKALATDLGMANSVIFTGRVPQDQVTRYYSLIDLLVYPRKSMRITELVTPLKPLEAMAQERLFIASDVGGHRELVRHRETGMLFKADDPAALAASVRDLLADADLGTQLKRAGRAFVTGERNWASSVQNYAPLYGELMRRGKPG